MKKPTVVIIIVIAIIVLCCWTAFAVTWTLDMKERQNELLVNDAGEEMRLDEYRY